MKIYISNYKDNWLSPYTVANKLMFWKKGEVETPPKWISKYCDIQYKILNKINKRIEYVHIDNFDIWNMNHTLALIIYPMLLKLRESKNGAPYVDDVDVPWYLRSTMYTKENEWDTDGNHFKRWDWVLDEMIWAFKQIIDEEDWQSRYLHGEFDYIFAPIENRSAWELVHGEKHTAWWDKEGHKKHQDCIDNGLKLFGKYYQNLWD